MNQPDPPDSGDASSPATAPQEEARQPLRPAAWLLALALLYTLYFARDIIMPVVLAALLGLLLAPAVRMLTRLWIPRPLAAGLVVFGLIGLAGYALSTLGEPAAEWMNTAPRVMREIEWKVRPLRETLAELHSAAEQIEQVAGGGEGEGEPKVTVEGNGLASRVMGHAQVVLSVAVLVAFLLFFLLASGDLFLRKLARVLPEWQYKRQAVAIAHEVQDEISRYLVTITFINAGLGVVVAVAMYLLGMPNPALWGAMAGLLNFVPYLGAFVSLVVLSVVALLTFDQLAYAAWVPIVFLAITTLEGQIITPHVVGARLALNVVVVFFGIIFWGWMWGVPGMLMAVPILGTIKIVADHVDRLGPLAEFLGR